MTLLRAFGPRLARKSKRATVQVFQGHWRGSNLQRKVPSNFATDFNIKTASAATAAEAHGDGRPPLSVICQRRLPLGRRTGADSASSAVHDTVSVTQRYCVRCCAVALALFGEELRKHFCFLNTFSFEAAPLPSPTERSHASTSVSLCSV